MFIAYTRLLLTMFTNSPRPMIPASPRSSHPTGPSLPNPKWLVEGSVIERGHEPVVKAVRALAEVIEPTLGPAGADKLLESSDPKAAPIITNDGATILRYLSLSSPAAALLADAALAQDDAIGDGTTSVVLLTSALVQALVPILPSTASLAQSVGPTMSIIKSRLENVILPSVRDCGIIAEGKVGDKDDEWNAQLEARVTTVLSSKVIAPWSSHFASLAKKLLTSVGVEVPSRSIVARSSIVFGMSGGPIEGSAWMEGLLLPLAPNRAALIQQLLGRMARSGGDEGTVNMVVFSGLRLYGEDAVSVDALKRKGIGLVVCDGSMGQGLAASLAVEGVIVIPNTPRDLIGKLCVMTGARSGSRIERASVVELDKGGLKLHRYPNASALLQVVPKSWALDSPRMSTVVLRAPSSLLLAEVERAWHDVMCVVCTATRGEQGSPHQSFVPGGGTVFIAASVALSESHPTCPVSVAFAEALNAIPATLARNAGLDPCSAVEEATAHHKEGRKVGVALLDPQGGKVDDLSKLGVIESLSLVESVLDTAVRTCDMLLRISSSVTVGQGKKIALN